MNSNVIDSTRIIGFIGLGSIGQPIAERLISAGFQLNIYNRTAISKNRGNLKSAKIFKSPKDLAERSDLLFICVSDDQAVEMILFGSNGVEKGLKKGSTIIDLSTISPHKAKANSIRLAKKNITYIDAPVSGGTEGAKAGTLTMFLGCNKILLKELESILSSIASNLYAFGTAGKGQEVKAINQILVAGCYVAVAEAITLGQKLGLPMNMVIEALQKGAANSWALKNRSQGMLEDKYPLGFKLGLHHKDLCIALRTAQESGLDLPITSKVRDIEEELINQGYTNDDISVIKRFFSKGHK
ncbi:NAD(P)-dependent oxidoreductase [Prochlorococcus sp. MIT 1307]|uniref:NAD(P)-dependent oxidoreductase n=1 Tax=Prochlorococcus sp. MIT 1307 TaxID=3096219 RepID=UPI002A7564F1|nr:NAD(P)-dependent oxidoreductase [Prochlorococcus sp. MIT 1307]